MKTHILFTFIMMTIIHAQAMELAIFSRHNNHYKNQILPDEVWDKIIAYSSHNTRKNIKETCTQLAYLTSINRLNTFIMHDFVIGDTTEKKAFLKAIIKTSNPKLITPIITHAQKEAQLIYLNDTPENIYITLESETNSDEESLIKLEEENASVQKNPYDIYIQTYIHKHYLKPLLKEAIKQDNAIMVDRIKKEENFKTRLIDTYEWQKKIQCNRLKDRICLGTLITLVTTLGAITGVFAITSTILTSPLCFYNYTQHCHTPLIV